MKKNSSNSTLYTIFYKIIVDMHAIMTMCKLPVFFLYLFEKIKKGI